eukprot:TRINITY_DN1566_c1_g1_i1.p1 TRINITY_DN1566_c1_g1~~TRINITY_DN1566_c1_g1_i1.p1  ORF type:complete len:491 (+),score=83.50 TRINITY_DN1566_c1_g1_i1:91-1563(+)
MNLFFAVLIFIASVGGGLFGYDTGVVSGAMIQIKSDDSDVDGMNLSSLWQETVVSVTTIGAALGSALCAKLNDSRGRKFVSLLSAAIFVGACILMGLSPNLTFLIIGRGWVGIAVGFAATTVPMYIAEVAPPESRGKLVTVNNVSIVGGQVFASLVACTLDVSKTPSGWRYMLGAGAIPGAIMFIGFLFLPESPRWLVSKGRVEDARACLTKIRNDDDDIDSELKELIQSLAEERSNFSLRDLWNDKVVMRALFVGCNLQLLQQLTGINTLMYYSASILQSSDDSNSNLPPWDHKNVLATCLSGAVSFAQMVGCIIGMFLIDKYGRRTLTLSSLAGVIFFLIALGAVFVGESNQTMASIAMCAYLLSFGIGMAAIPWVFNSEIYPLYARATCISVATTVNWCSSFAISFTFLTLSEAISTNRDKPKDHPDGAFWLYALFGIIGFVYLYKYMPETKGLTLEEITHLFERESDKETLPLLSEKNDAIVQQSE